MFIRKNQEKLDSPTGACAGMTGCRETEFLLPMMSSGGSRGRADLPTKHYEDAAEHRISASETSA